MISDTNNHPRNQESCIRSWGLLAISNHAFRGILYSTFGGFSLHSLNINYTSQNIEDSSRTETYQKSIYTPQNDKPHPWIRRSQLPRSLNGQALNKCGSRDIATLGILFLTLATIIHLTLEIDSPYYIVLSGSLISGIGTSMFFSANTSAIMANARAGSYGSISGLQRILQNIGILGSFVLAISMASVSILRNVAFEVLIGTIDLTGGLTTEFLAGIDAALYASLLLLVIAGVLSFVRGKE